MEYFLLILRHILTKWLISTITLLLLRTIILMNTTTVCKSNFFQLWSPFSKSSHRPALTYSSSISYLVVHHPCLIQSCHPCLCWFWLSWQTNCPVVQILVLVTFVHKSFSFTILGIGEPILYFSNIFFAIILDLLLMWYSAIVEYHQTNFPSFVYQNMGGNPKQCRLLHKLHETIGRQIEYFCGLY